jgi:hypothetical protein
VSPLFLRLLLTCVCDPTATHRRARRATFSTWWRPAPSPATRYLPFSVYFCTCCSFPNRHMSLFVFPVCGVFFSSSYAFALLAAVLPSPLSSCDVCCLPAVDNLPLCRPSQAPRFPACRWPCAPRVRASANWSVAACSASQTVALSDSLESDGKCIPPLYLPNSRQYL